MGQTLRDSLIIFDEVQNYPKARELIKYLVKDGRYDYIETGSLISIKNNVKDIQIPSEERVIQMTPMDFEEWLWANGDMDTMPAIMEHFEKREPFGQTMHRVMTDKYRQYMQVGGMPGAVSTFLENHDMVEVENAKRDILALYRRDMRKNSDPDATQLIFDNLPELLSSHCKVFSPGALVRGSVTSDYSKAFDWLFESKILNRCVSNTDPNAAMNMGNRSIRFKKYLLDTGLLITLALDVGTLDRTVVVEFAKSNLGINEGMLLENMVAQELTTSGHKLFFSEFYDKEDDKHLYEVDFIMVNDGKIVPIEVKSSYSGRHASLDRFIEKYRKRLGQPFVIHQKDLKVGEDGIIYIPVYMASLL